MCIIICDNLPLDLCKYECMDKKCFFPIAQSQGKDAFHSATAMHAAEAGSVTKEQPEETEECPFVVIPNNFSPPFAS